MTSPPPNPHLTMMTLDPTTGYAFPGPNNLRQTLYPSISAHTTPSLHQPGKTVLITGAGRGIGRATALQYAHAGVSHIILCARTHSELEEVASRIREIDSSICVRVFVVDVSRAEDVKRLVAALSGAKEGGGAEDKESGDGTGGRTAEREGEGRLDVLILNAGMASSWVPIAHSDAEEWWNTFTVNLRGPFLCLHGLLPLLERTAKRTGAPVHVVSVSSLGAMLVTPGASAYQTSKLALCRLTEFVHCEYAEKGVVAVSLHPGAVPTALAAGNDLIKDYLIDTPELGGGFMVWITAAKRDWLAGRYVSATWDVDVLEGMKEEIVQGDKLKVKMVV